MKAKLKRNKITVFKKNDTGYRSFRYPISETGFEYHINTPAKIIRAVVYEGTGHKDCIKDCDTDDSDACSHEALCYDVELKAR